MERQVVVDDKTYSLATIRIGQAKNIQFSGKKGIEFNLAIVEASLKAAGDDSSVDDIPFFGGFSDVLDAALEVNGLKKLGEVPAAPKVEAADSTLSGSTEA